MENDIYSFIDIAVLITRREMLREDGRRSIIRFIDQIAYFERTDGKNICHMILDQGKLLKGDLPQSLSEKLSRAEVNDPLMASRFMGEAAQRPLYVRSAEQKPKDFEMIPFKSNNIGTFRGIM